MRRFDGNHSDGEESVTLIRYDAAKAAQLDPTRTSAKVCSVKFGESDLDLLATTREIRVETRSKSGDVHRTIVWPLVRDGAVYLRSYRGPDGRWYREALADPDIALLFDRRRVPARAVPALDAVSVEACSTALKEKYRRSYSLEAMLEPAVLPTTLRIEPAQALGKQAPTGAQVPGLEPATATAGSKAR